MQRYNCSNCKTLVVDTRRQGVNDLCTECDAKFLGIFPMVASEAVPPGELWILQDRKITGKIINMEIENNVT